MKTKTTLTNREINLFKSEVKRLWELWGMTGWVLDVSDDDCEYDASCSTNLLQRRILIQVNRKPKKLPLNDDAIKELARHEMIHALLEPIGSLNFSRFVTKDECDAADHEVLHRLSGLLPK